MHQAEVLMAVLNCHTYPSMICDLFGQLNVSGTTTSHQGLVLKPKHIQYLCTDGRSCCATKDLEGKTPSATLV